MQVLIHSFTVRGDHSSPLIDRTNYLFVVFVCVIIYYWCCRGWTRLYWNLEDQFTFNEYIKSEHIWDKSQSNEAKISRNARRLRADT